MIDFKCRNSQGGQCLKVTKGIVVPTEYCSSCCIGCKHALEMDCFTVCPTVAEYYHPEDGEFKPKEAISNAIIPRTSPSTK